MTPPPQNSWLLVMADITCISIIIINRSDSSISVGMEDIQLLNTIKMKLGGRFWQCVTGLQKCMSFHLPGSTLLTIIVQYSYSALYGFHSPSPQLFPSWLCPDVKIDAMIDQIFVSYTLFVPGSGLAIITRSKRLKLVPLRIHEMVSDLPNYYSESVTLFVFC